VVFLDAGGTLIHLDRRFILATLAAAGAVRDAAAFDAAHRAAHAAAMAALRQGQAANDDARWRLYGQLLMRELGCPPERAEEVRAAVQARHREARLWTRVVDGTAAALTELRAAGYTLCVVSNADGRVERFLEHAGLRVLLDHVVDSGLVGVEKPDPRIFAIACERVGAAPAECVHVGDVYAVDVAGARAAGVAPVLLDPLDEEPRRDVARIRALGELPPLLARGLPLDASAA